MKTDIIIVNDFYENPDKVREYALSQRYYYPFINAVEPATGKVNPVWETSYFKEAADCPFKSSKKIIQKLEEITGETIDIEHWNKSFPVSAEQKLLPGYKNVDRSARWNCCFQIKYHDQPKGTGVHNHMRDVWNEVGEMGWAGIVYLSPDAPLNAGLHLWKNRFGNPYEWDSSRLNWDLVDQFANVYNRLILHRGWMPHSGGAGFGRSRERGRLLQTFFFKTLNPKVETGLQIELQDVKQEID